MVESNVTPFQTKLLNPQVFSFLVQCHKITKYNCNLEFGINMMTNTFIIYA
jgi:hypothetical protein